MTLSERLEKLAEDMPMARDGHDLHSELRSIAAELRGEAAAIRNEVAYLKPRVGVGTYMQTTEKPPVLVNMLEPMLALAARLAPLERTKP